ncbi:hypothetical protein [Intestinibacter sp.]
MKATKEKIKLDEILKYLFTTSERVLINLLNGIFEENFDSDEVSVTITNSEFVEDTLEILRGDMFFNIFKKGDDGFDKNKMNYHLEFQTKNDNTMVIRMFEYGFRKGKENSEIADDSIRKLYFPKQKVIFFEENKNIQDTLELLIVFSEEQKFLYKVDVIKYWHYTDEELIKKKMYPLLPLQLFNLRKELQYAKQNNDVDKIRRLSVVARKLATKLANESKELLDNDEILGEDFHKMLLAIQNLIEYLNRNYIGDDRLEDEVNIMTKTLYDPEVEKRGIQKGIQKGIKQGIDKGIEDTTKQFVLNMRAKGLDAETIADLTQIDIEKVEEIIKKQIN